MHHSAIIVFLIASTLLACRPSGKTNEPQTSRAKKTTQNAKIEFAYDTTMSRIADFIAGEYRTEELKNKDIISVYGRHKQIMDSLFDEAWVKNFSTMQSWAKTYLPEGQKKDYTLFYPFSGPDFFNAYYLFPQAKEYIMFGLEPAGILPDSNDLKDASFLKSISYSLRTTIAKNFFITREMNVDYGMKKDVGIATMLLMYASRTNHKIIRYSYVLIDAAGEKTEYKNADDVKNKSGVKGIKLELADEQGETQSVTYLSFNAENGKISDSNGVGKYLNSFDGKTYGLLKAASYLLHYDGFSTIRTIILSKCSIIMSDDSGLPYDIMQKHYKVQLFGEYSDPISEFSFIKLHSMKAAYEKGNIFPLPFKFGYGYGKKVMVGKL